MKKRLKKMLGVLLACVMSVSAVGMSSAMNKAGIDGAVTSLSASASQSRTGYFNKGFTLSGNQANDMVTVAKKQLGKTGSQLNYSEQWCADFTLDVARLASVKQNVIPYGYASSANCNYFYKTITNGTFKGNLVSNVNAKPGDIIFFDWSGRKSRTNLGHVGIVTANNGRTITMIGGNQGSANSLYNRKVTTVNYSVNSSYIAVIVRPNYTNRKDDYVTPLPSGSIYQIVPACATGSAIDVTGLKTANGTNIELWKQNGGKNQQFKAVLASNGYYAFYDSNSGKVLDVAGGRVADGTNVQLYKYNGTASQLWRLIDAGGGYYRVQSKLNSKYYLDINGGASKNGTNVQLWSGNNSNAQRFKFNQVSNSSTTSSPKTYTVKSNSGAKVRTSASTSGNHVGGLGKGSIITYDKTVTSGGYTWYHITKVNKSASGSWITKGYSYVDKWIANV